MTGKKIVLLSCGSFNPPTNMHLRMFELARDQLHKLGYEVVLGLISPVHDGYGKKGLVPSTDRIAMLKLALQDSDWIKLSDWEPSQENHTRTAVVIKYHQTHINNILNNKLNDNINEQDIPWFLNGLQSLPGDIYNIQVKLLCGADLLESFDTPGLWAIEDSNITVINEWIRNDVSSTKIRRALRRNESVKYLVPDQVIDYITRQELYGWTNNNFKHPGQAVQIITDSFGDHKIVKNRQDPIRDNEVCGGDGVGQKSPPNTLKTSQSCTNFDKLDTRWSLQGSKSNDDLNGYKNCDENLIKFIFTKHGIQVISDIETIV
ncbi:nicotinamide mononucleotide adenylyltransferase [Holotrichia oblita]|uniref:Nicotinamide mononucleotide adenylyltransferase n=1 Tax=Holotrichia oblita TaxID=644536 RepID=A0ACB9T155_HOLOL|nr:nicotinamide mononucleotide adenylyltransferase [Holotrichia oblita]